MENYIIIGAVVLIVLFAIWTLLKRSGKKGCCGSSGDYKPRKKKLKKVIATKIFVVEGMHCEKCRNRIMEAVNDIPGTSAVVKLKKGTATVSYEYDVSDEQIKAKIERLGYFVSEIR